MTAPARAVVRDGSAADAAALLPLLDALGYPSDTATLGARLSAMFASDASTRLLIAEAGGRAVGFATLHATPVPHRPTPVGRITAIAVAEDAQGTGAGRLLVEAAEAHFGTAGIARLEVTSGDNHKAAHTFYLHLGYTNQGIRFAKELGR